MKGINDRFGHETGDAALEGIFPVRPAPFIGRQVHRVFQTGLEKLSVSLREKEVSLVQPEGLGTGITHAFVDGFFHAQVLARVALMYVDERILSKRQSTGEEDAWYDKELSHRQL